MEIMHKRRRGNEKSDNHGVDRVSSLPNYLLHLIMSMLSTKQVEKMSILSKGLEASWATFPLINLDETNYIDGKRFVQFFQRYLLRYEMDNLQSLRLRVISAIDDELYDLIEGLVTNAALKGNLQHLKLKFYNGMHPKDQEYVCDSFYLLPEVIFTRGSSLISLKLVGVRVDSDKFLNVSLLRILCLKNVVVEDDFLQRLMHACPILETLCIIYCYGLKNIRIVHHRLQNFVLGHNPLLEKVQIHLPKLRSLKYKGYHHVDDLGDIQVFEVDILDVLRDHKIDTFCMKHAILDIKAHQHMQFGHLRNLVLSDVEVNQACFWLSQSCFPSLESLILKRCRGIEHLVVISPKIRTLSIENCMHMHDFKILAPELQVFNYEGEIIYVYGLRLSDNAQVNLTLKMFESEHNHILKAFQLRDFLQAFSPASMITLKLFQDCTQCLMRLKERNKPALTYIEQLEVQIERKNNEGLIDILRGCLSISTLCNTLRLFVESLELKLEFKKFNGKGKLSSQALQILASNDNPLEYLEKVWISGFGATEEELHQVSYVIERAKRLKYLSISMTDRKSVVTNYNYLKLQGWKESLAHTLPGLEFAVSPLGDLHYIRDDQP